MRSSYKILILYLQEEVSVWSSCLKGSGRFSYKEIHKACSAIHIHQGDCSNHRRELKKRNNKSSFRMCQAGSDDLDVSV